MSQERYDTLIACIVDLNDCIIRIKQGLANPYLSDRHPAIEAKLEEFIKMRNKSLEELRIYHKQYTYIAQKLKIE